MSGAMKKDAKDFIPYCADQGIPNIAGTNAPGVSIQVLPNWSMPAGGAVVFADEGLSDMADTAYAVLLQNQTDVADPGVAGSKAASGFTITGPDQNDVLDIIIIGRLSGQLG